MITISCLILGGTLYVVSPDQNRMVEPTVVEINQKYLTVTNSRRQILETIDNPTHPWYGMNAVEWYSDCYDRAMKGYLDEEE